MGVVTMGVVAAGRGCGCDGRGCGCHEMEAPSRTDGGYDGRGCGCHFFLPLFATVLYSSLAYKLNN
jgi:hypothetical protein